jgi:two-component system chemotaxis response regulator CheB
VVGASAGGVEALSAFFRELPADLGATVLVVLHVSPHGPSQLARILGRLTPLPVKAAENDEAVLPGQVYVALADRHLMVQDDRIRITRGPREGRSRPSVDVLFRSAALAYEARVISVVLSGALDDGTAGAWAVKDRGGIVLVQEPREAMHASMPESAIEHVEVDHVAPAKELASIVAGLVGVPVKAKGAEQHSGLAIENLIAEEGNGLQAGVMDLGKVSKYTCPDCHGVLVQIEEGSIIRYRCHTGHAFSLMSLLAEVNEAIDTGLWDTLRAIEERIMLLEQMEKVAKKAGHSDEAATCRTQADDAKKRLIPIRELVLDPGFFGH